MANLLFIRQLRRRVSLDVVSAVTILASKRCYFQDVRSGWFLELDTPMHWSLETDLCSIN
jgi:hypothetical protein